MSIKWATVLGYDHLLVSTNGQVKSKARLCQRKNGGKGSTQYRDERKIIPGNKDGYLWINISMPGSKGQTRKFLSVHKLMVETFIRPLKDKEEIDHINGNRSDNRLENLQIVANKDEHAKLTWQRIFKKHYDQGYAEGYKAALEFKELVKTVIEDNKELLEALK